MDKTTPENIRIGTWLYHSTLRNRDGTALRARVNGKCKTWKREPGRFQLPMKYGLRDCFYITQDDAYQWLEFDITDAKARAQHRAKVLAEDFARELELDPNTPWEIIHDMLLEYERTNDALHLKHYILNSQGN